jgi:hypothetical protein
MFPVSNPAFVNFLIQSLLIAVLALAVYLAKVRRNLKTHCRLFHVAVLVEIMTVVSPMGPSTLGFLLSAHTNTLIKAEIAVHHFMGLFVIGVWLFASLVRWRLIRFRGRQVTLMRLALAAWLISFILGGHLYFYIYGF